MWVFLGAMVLVLIIAAGAIAVEMSSTRRNKLLSGLAATVVFFTAISWMLGGDNEEKNKPVSRSETAPTAAVPSAPRSEPMSESRTVTLQNYRSKGDNVTLECSGSTGNIKCKPAR
jgi:MFS superfamily sulfate permease-like transporter